MSRGTDLRGIMQRAGEAVADAGLVPMEQAITMRGGAGYHDLALALSGWSDVFRAGNLEQIMARSVITEAMLSEASDIVREIIAITGENSLREEKIAEVNDIRRRMFSVCVKRYEDVRRGATFMRWFHDDVDAFTPSLYAKGSRKADVKPAPVATPVVEPNGPVANAPVVKPVVATPVGHPNSSPFIG